MNRVVVRPLSDRETALLSECEETIATGIMTFAEVGQALLIVRDHHLFRRDFATFEDYCAGRWQISRSRGYQLMSAASVVSTMVDNGLPAPENERQARALVDVPEEQRLEVWQQVQERTDGSPTAAAIRAVAEETAGLAGPAPDADPASAAGTAAAGVDIRPAAAPQAATADRVDTAVASPDTANRPGPAETSTAGATGAGPTPAPVADTPFVLPDPDNLPPDLDPAAVERYREKLAAAEQADYLHQFAKAMSRAHAFLRFDAERIARVDAEQVQSVAELANAAARFHDRMTKASGLRLMQGGRA